MFGRALAEEHAEEARLLYVAATRARDRLIVSGPTGEGKGYAGWLEPGLEDAVEAHQVPAAPEGPAEAEARERRTDPSTDDDTVTGTGRQLDAFGFDHAPEDERGQLNLFAARREAGSEEEAGDESPGSGARVVLFRTPDPIQASLTPAPVELWWLEGLRERAAPEITRPIPAPRHSFTSSATELRMQELDPDAWRLRYGHGVVPTREFVGRAGEVGRLPATVRGTLIHTVLERLEAEYELARVLGEAIAGLDAPESETLLEPGSAYRQALEAEIAAVVSSEEWAHYVEGLHWRELRFLHLVGPRDWRLGAFDLFRPVSGQDGSGGSWIVDFKTHEIDPDAVPETAAGYEVQARVYRDAAESVLGRPARVSLHFTHPNVAIDV
jgi:ATP-dependent exoDNAse (exonuclease V) beta subunit